MEHQLEAGSNELHTSGDAAAASPAGCTATEAQRLAALHSLELVGTGSEPHYDDLTRLASLICGTPTAMLSLVDRDRQWFKSRVGMELQGTPREESICSYVIERDEVLVIEDTTLDSRLSEMPLVRSGRIHFYAGAPIQSPEGYRVGTICVTDTVPRTLTEPQKEALRALARQAAAYLLIHKQCKQLSEAALRAEFVERELRHNEGLLQEANRLLQQLATTDALTGLTNRRVLESSLERHSDAKGQPLSLLMIDVDHFKWVNDRLGHKAGDVVLKRLAGLLRSTTRDTDTLCRYGGEEFVLLIPGMEHSAALERAETLRAAVEADAEGLTAITVSIGVATALSQPGGIPVDLLLIEADRALYAAKSAGRNCVRSARPQFSEPAALAALAGTAS